MGAHNKLQLVGLTEFQRALRQLPEELTKEASAIVLAHAEEAKRETVTGYPEHTGNLRRGVTIERNTSKFTTHALVKSRARHAHLFERGTVQRRTNRGWNRGAMPEAPEQERMIPKVIRARRRMVSALMDLVERAGFQVSR